jgi:hypothetical protein
LEAARAKTKRAIRRQISVDKAAGAFIKLLEEFEIAVGRKIAADERHRAAYIKMLKYAEDSAEAAYGNDEPTETESVRSASESP